MDAETDQICGGGANSHYGYRERGLATCVGTLTPRIPKLRSGSFFPEDVLDRHRRIDRALVATVAEMYATGTSTRKVQRVAEKMGVTRLSKDQVSAIASGLDADIKDQRGSPLDGSPVPYVWLDASYVKCRRGAAGRRVLGVNAVDTVSCDSWPAFLRAIHSRWTAGARLVISDAHPGLIRALGNIYQSAARSTSCATACAKPAPLGRPPDRHARVGRPRVRPDPAPDPLEGKSLGAVRLAARDPIVGVLDRHGLAG